jgi:FGGY-family pentulose kinase
MEGQNREYVIGIDIGTGSVRAGIFDLTGHRVAYSQKDIKIWHPKENFVEQSSDDIWSKTCLTVKEALLKGKLLPDSIIGISFDATCSLVVLDKEDNPISVSPTNKSEQNVIVWMDHRAIEQAERINSLHHDVLKYVGGKISPEQEPPKLLWIKENLPDTWDKAGKFLDLADFMTYKSTGKNVRSLCTTVCKWTYLGHDNKWDKTFYKQAGLEELFIDDKIGSDIRPMGSYIGNLTDKAANELGLTPNVKVATGIIDAHAGGIGVIGLEFDSVPQAEDLERILALIGGTSTCHMAVSKEARFIPGVWGPYYSAMIPGMWLTEGGQSATGSLIDFIIRNNSKYTFITQKANEENVNIYQYLNKIISEIKQTENKGPEITKDINILPYFIGNRSPRADATAKGIISGITLDESTNTIARIYYAAIQAIAYGTLHIIETLNSNGYKINKIYACGGGTKNNLWLQEHSDITGCEIIVSKESESVLLGTAILASVGSGKFNSILEASVKMSSSGKKYIPDKRYQQYHKAKYKVFKMMYDHFNEYNSLLEQF